jgi:Protein of unknown function (DUF3761)
VFTKIVRAALISIALAGAAHADTGTTSTGVACNNDTYTNASGETVHSPSCGHDNETTDKKTAICRDQSVSFSHSRRGTCSRHGGVAQWL